MKIIKQICEDIEKRLDLAEDAAKKATLYKIDYPEVAQTYLKDSETHLELMNNLHDKVVFLINGYKKEKGEPPAPMMAIYDYMHERFISKAAAIKNLQGLYKQ